MADFPGRRSLLKSSLVMFEMPLSVPTNGVVLVRAGQMKLPAGANENQCAEQLAQVLYRAVDRMV